MSIYFGMILEILEKGRSAYLLETSREGQISITFGMVLEISRGRTMGMSFGMVSETSREKHIFWNGFRNV